MGKPCKVTRFYADLPEEDKNLFAGLLRNPLYSGMDIANIVRAAGHDSYKINRHSVEHFRRKLQEGTATL